MSANSKWEVDARQLLQRWMDKWELWVYEEGIGFKIEDPNDAPNARSGSRGRVINGG